MDEPIEESYFNWLYSKVASVEVPTPSLTFYALLRCLHSIEFVWLILNDDNRAADGLELREEFLDATGYDVDDSWLLLSCSVLEMFIAFSRRAEFTTNLSAKEWFWIFLDNLSIADLSDARHNVERKTVDVIHIFLWRMYDYLGVGGICPLENSNEDQRQRELWAQLCDYISEKEIDL